jgi:hypothetical protein
MEFNFRDWMDVRPVVSVIGNETVKDIAFARTLVRALVAHCSPLIRNAAIKSSTRNAAVVRNKIHGWFSGGN